MMNHSFKNQKGNILVQVLVATAVMGTSFYFLTNYVIGQAEQVNKTANVVNLRFAMNSAMDYMIFGIRQKYCFVDGLLINDEPSKCNLMHTGSVERVIMSVEQENFIRQLLIDNVDVGAVDATKIRLPEINLYLRIDAVTTNHPLFPVLDKLKAVRDNSGAPIKVDGMRITIRRNDTVYIPKAGREVYLDLNVALMKSASASEPLQVGTTRLSMNSQLAIYPREVGTFALLTPNDLRLDVNWEQKLAVGDVGIHQFTSQAEVGNSPGLVFQSPVFVNRNVHLPFDGSDKVLSPPYSPVTFADRVYLGNGQVLSNGSPYRPKSSGGIGHQTWADVRTFGGFLRGVENDGGFDAGLQYFAKIQPSAIVDSDLAKNCYDLDKKTSARDEIFKSSSQLNTKSSSSGTEFDYEVSLTNGNSFSAQRTSLTDSKSSWKGSLQRSKKNGDPIMLMKFHMGDQAVEFNMPRAHKVTLTAKVENKGLEYTLGKAVSDADRKIDDLTRDKNNLTSKVTSNKNKIASLQSDLDKELDKPPYPSGGSGSEPDEGASGEPAEPPSGGSGSAPPDPKDYRDPTRVASLESQIASLVTENNRIEGQDIPKKENEILAAREIQKVADENLQRYRNAINNPATVEIETYDITTMGFFVSSRKVGLKIDVKRPEHMIYSNGDLVTKPALEVLSYDGTYYRGEVIYDKNNTDLKGFINYTNNTNGTWTSPNAFSRSLSGSLVAGGGGLDYDDLEQKCEKARSNNPSQSFGGAGWSSSFANTARYSWNFANPGDAVMGKDPAIDVLQLSGLNRSNATFQVRSIVGRCEILANTDFITGFFACDELIIHSRNTPLRIIGTFIVGKMKIAPEALRAGITWSSIYHPQATAELRRAKVLQARSGRDCEAVTSADEPVWHPLPSAQTVSDRMSCNTISLRAQANPFQWTAVDPDCGMLPGKAVTSCKKRLVRFFVAEQSRGGGL